MGYLYILGTIAAIGLVFYLFSRPKKEVNGFSIPSGTITRDMKDPYSQAVWAAFDSGQAVSYSAGDEKMKSFDEKTGEVTEIEFKS